MKCQKCDSKLYVIDTFQAGSNAKTASAACRNCGWSCTLITVIATENTGKYGNGAYATAKKIEEGKDPQVFLDQTPAESSDCT